MNIQEKAILEDCIKILSEIRESTTIDSSKSLGIKFNSVANTLAVLINESTEDINKNSPEYDSSGNAKHYNVLRLNTMDIFERTFGTLALMNFCEISAMKYRCRIGYKNQPLEQEVNKIHWYDQAASILLEKIQSGNDIVRDNTEITEFKIYA